MRGGVERSVPFVRFRVERALERSRDDEALSAVGAVIKPLPQGILRDELIRLASSRLGISPDLVESAIRTARPAPVGARGRRSGQRAAPPEQRRAPGARPPRAVRARVPRALRRPAGARRGEARDRRPRRALHLPAHPPRRRAPPRPPRAPGLRHRRRPRARRADPRDRPPGRPARRHPGDARARGPPARPPRLDREITAARTGGESEVHVLAAERQKILDAIRHRLQ